MTINAPITGKMEPGEQRRFKLAVGEILHLFVYSSAGGGGATIGITDMEMHQAGFSLVLVCSAPPTSAYDEFMIAGPGNYQVVNTAASTAYMSWWVEDVRR